ncbi:MAG: maleylpyruvate isomerase family mycothiol-dependent enzyme [Candidatus Dormiibacterota bacterium]
MNRGPTPKPEPAITDWIASIDRESRSLAQAVAGAGLDAPVPTCPDWRVRDLMRHLGGVHRWAATHVSEARMSEMGQDETEAVMDSFPEDASLPEWFEEGHQTLGQVLVDAPSDLKCWSFLPAPSPLAFWARRQAHETEIHRADAEFAAGSDRLIFPAAVAADGIEEILFGFGSRARRLSLDREYRLAVIPQDRPEGWLVHLGPNGIRAQRRAGDADCHVRGTASDLYLLLWNRLPGSALTVEGDQTALASWQSTMQVTWS